MEDYFELQLDGGDMYKGQLSQDRTEFSGVGIYTKKDKYVAMGNLKESKFAGLGAILDLVELTLYLGTLENSEKHGYGVLRKFRAGNDARVLMDEAHRATRDNFFETVEKWVNQARQMEAKARKRSQKIQSKMTLHADLKIVLLTVKMTVEESKTKRKRRIPKSQKLWVEHVGEFSYGKRTGWGSSMFKTSDLYQGFFQNDRMHGRGTYWFANVTNSVFYVGEFLDNSFHGLGKMVFQDGSTYLGSFVNNSMSSKRAVMSYANGLKYKGEIEMSKRHGQGEYWQLVPQQEQGQDAQGAAANLSLHYEGEFRDDLRDGNGVLTLTSQDDGQQLLRYEGEYRDDKRHGRVEEFSAVRETDNQRVCYRGSLDQNELLSGMGVLEAGNAKYTGDFQVNQFNGEGKIEYADTGNVFKGQFAFHQKNGPATFTLKSGQQYSGVFQTNVSVGSKDNFGPRF